MNRRALLAAMIATTLMLGLIVVLPVGESGGGPPPFAYFTVNSLSDAQDHNYTQETSADGVCDTGAAGNCTLRAALWETEQRGGYAVINFTLPGNATIPAGNEYDLEFVDHVTIDGTTQPGYAGIPIVKINASAVGGMASSVFDIYISDEVTIQGLDIFGADANGISVTADGCCLSDHIIRDNHIHDLIGVTGNAVVIIDEDNITVSGNTLYNNAGTGIGITDSLDVSITSNTIFGNGEFGVATADESVDSARITLSKNSIHSNGDIGIDWNVDGVTANDDGDVDGGSNALQNFPYAITADATADTVSGKINTTKGATVTVEAFKNDACDASGNGEGKTYLASHTFTTGTGSNETSFSFSTTLTAGDIITLTATTANGTSEFSQCATATGAEPSTDSGTKSSDFLPKEDEGEQEEEQPPEEEPPAPVTTVTVGEKGGAIFGSSKNTNVKFYHRTVDGSLNPIDGEVEGQVVLRYEGAGASDNLRYVLIGENGERIVLGEGREVAWDTTEVPNGVYTLQVERVGSGSGTQPAQGAVAVDKTTFVVRNPEATVAVATAAVAVGAGVAIGAQLLAAAGQAGQELGMGLGEDVLKGATSGRSKRLKRWGERMPSRVAVGLTLVLMALFFTFEGVEGWDFSGYLAALPIVGAAAVVFTVLELSMETLLARVSGAIAKIRLNGSGVISLVASSVFLRTAVGYPGYVQELDEDGTSDDLAATTEAIRAGAVMAGILGTMVLFIVAGMFHFEFMNVGLEMGIAALIATSLPLKPMPGHEIWVWNKFVAIGVFVTALAVFVLVQTALLNLLGTFILGVVGLVAYAGVAWWLRHARINDKLGTAEEAHTT